MKIDRNKFANELKLRQYIRKVIKIVENRRKNEKKEHILQEKRLRSHIRTLIKEASVPDSEESPHKSTGINILEDLLKKIIPIIEIDYKKLTTSKEQRDSYRAHMVQGAKNLLIPPKVTDDAEEEEVSNGEKFIPITENPDINIAIGDEKEAPDEFIDVSPQKKSKEEDEKEVFTIVGEDETGRDMAYNSFKQVQGSILDSWEILFDEDDKELFFDYLITNLKLYFDKFEDELAAMLPEPTTPEYEEAVAGEVE